MIDKYIVYMKKVFLWTFFVLVFMCVVTPVMYKEFFTLINTCDKTILERYTTDDKFEDCIFFIGEEVDNSHIVDQLKDEIAELKTADNEQKFGKIIFENKDAVKKIVSKNINYQNYLMRYGCSVDDVISWSEKISEIDDKIFLACLYISFLIASFIMVILLKLRKTFYFVAGIIYTLAIVSLFSDGIAEYIYIDILNWLGKLSKVFISYGDREVSSLILFQAFKESTLTFIIFDSIIQFLENKGDEDIKKAHKYLYASIDVQSRYLEQMNNDDILYIARMKIKRNPIIKCCDNEIKKLEKEQKKRSSYIRNYKNQKLDYYKEFKKELNWICTNTEEHTNAEYIEKLHKIQWLFYKCDFEY